MSRKFFEESDLWGERRKFSRAEAWLDILFLAAFKTYIRTIGEDRVTLRRAEFFASMQYLANRWGWSKRGVHLFLGKLQKSERLTKRRTERTGTVYLVNNYDLYQRLPTKAERQTERPGERQRNGSGTKKEQVVIQAVEERGESAEKPARHPATPVVPLGDHRVLGNRSISAEVREREKKKLAGNALFLDRHVSGG